MATWNELFLDEKNIAVLPQPEIYKFAKKVEDIFQVENDFRNGFVFEENARQFLSKALLINIICYYVK